MTSLELLAPARNADIGIAAIDCGADAVYIAGPAFGARKDAGNPVSEIRRLCDHAHKFGARVFVTVNIELSDSELPEVRSQMLDAQDAGADAFIIRDMRICSWKDITVPLHASTQCAIRDAVAARACQDAGCERIVLERELSLEQVKAVREAVSCEIEFFVHGALCVCYSGECRLSEYLDGRSADRGECIQACRSLYDLEDASGKVLMRSKALLSLRDLNLRSRLSELANAGVCSFKIEGRLKNISYVRNITCWYSMALDELVAAHPDKYRRASFGTVRGGFIPDPDKTFNRGYTQLYIDGRRGSWACLDAPKSMGERLGTVLGVQRLPGASLRVRIRPEKKGTVLRNGDGFAFVGKDSVVGFRADRCEGDTLFCKEVAGLREGTVLFRNVSTAFEKELESNLCRREVSVSLSARITGKWSIAIEAVTEDGRALTSTWKADVEAAENRERAEAMIREQLGKRSLQYSFKVVSVEAGGALPLLSAATLNGMRRLLASDLDALLREIPSAHGSPSAVNASPSSAKSPAGSVMEPLMRSKYCIKYELGLCPVHQGAKPTGPLYLRNNGRRLSLGFDCARCEMTVSGS